MQRTQAYLTTNSTPFLHDTSVIASSNQLFQPIFKSGVFEARLHRVSVSLACTLSEMTKYDSGNAEAAE